MKTMLLLCALIAGSSSVWAEDVKVIDEDFNAGTASGWTLDGKTSFQGSAGAKSLQIASSKGDGTAMTPAFSSLVGTTATLTFSISSANSNVNTLTITGNSCKVDGETSTTASTDEGTVTIAITEASTTSTITFSASKNAGCKIDDVVVSYTSGGDPTTYTVTTIQVVWQKLVILLEVGILSRMVQGQTILRVLRSQSQQIPYCMLSGTLLLQMASLISSRLLVPVKIMGLVCL